MLPRLTRRVDHLRPRPATDADVAAHRRARSSGFGSACTVVRRVARVRRGGRDRDARRAAPAGARAATRCRTRWRRSPSASSSACRSTRSPRRSPSFAAPSGASSGAAKSTASRSSTTTAITRPRSPRCWRRRARPTPARIVVAFQPHRYTRTRDLMREFGAGAGGGRRGRADRHLRGRARSRSPASRSRRWPRPCNAAPSAPGARRAERSTTWPPALADLARARRPGDHARRRIDRRRGRPRWSRELERRHGRRRPRRDARGLPPPPTSGSAARTSSRRAGAARRLTHAWLAVAAVGAGARWSATARYRGVTLIAASPALQISHMTRARQRAAVDRRGAGAARRPARAEHPDGDLDEWRQRLLASPWVETRRCAACCRRRVEIVDARAAADGHRPARHARCI